MKRLSVLLLIALAGCLLASCAPLKSVSRIKLHDARIKYVVPSGFHSLHGVLSVRLHNPSDEFFFDDIQGVIRNNKTVVATLSGERIFIKGHATHNYDIPCTIHLAKGTSLLDLIAMAANGSYKALTIDLTTTVYAGKQHKKFRLKDIDLEEFLTR